MEDWKYTNLTPFLKQAYATEIDDENITITDSALAKAAIAGLDCYKVVLVNGKYNAGYQM